MWKEIDVSNIMLVVIVPGAANMLISKRIDPILDQHIPKKEG